MKSISLQGMTVHIFELKICLSGFFKSPLWCIGFTTLFPTFTQTIFKELYPCIYTLSIISWAELPLPEAVVRSVDIPET